MRRHAALLVLASGLAAAAPLARAAASDDAGRPGKTIVNRGSRPVRVTIDFWNGSTRSLVVPAGRSLDVPAGVVAIGRSSVDQMNLAAPDAKVVVQGDGAQAELTHEGHSSTLRTDPWRPEVLQPASAPAKGGDAAAQVGKTVVNEGRQPVPIVVDTSDGQTVHMVVPPGEAVALPAGTTRVERDALSNKGSAARNEPVRVAGDGTSVELASTGGSQAVVLDPDRPEVVQPASRPISGTDAVTSQMAQPGKTVANEGKRPVPVDVYTADGEVRTIVVPPGQAVALPPGTTRVERDATTKAGVMARDEPVRVMGDHNLVNLTAKGGSQSAVMDPDRPGVLQPGATDIKSAGGAAAIVEQPGKSAMNLGSKPVPVDVHTADGEVRTIVVPPGQAVALPPGATRVERDATTKAGVMARDVPLRVAGDGKSVELGAKGAARSAVLDPDRPEVAQSAAQAAPKGAEGREDLERQNGKTLVNYGDKPVPVEITLANGERQVLTVPPGEAVAVPAGVTRIERDTITMEGSKARDTKVQLTGDGKTSDLPTGEGATKSLVLNPGRPEVVLPGEFDARAAGRGTEFQDGKTLVNSGAMPVPVDITMANGQVVTVTIPPGQGIALPPGAVGIEAETLSMKGSAAKDATLRVIGDGQNMPFTAREGIRLDPAKAESLARTARSAGGWSRSGGGREAEGGASVPRPAAPAPTPRPKPRPKPAPSPTPPPKPGPDAYDGTYRGRAGTTALTLRIREGAVEFQVDKVAARGAVTAEGRITANWSGVMGTMRVEYGRDVRDLEILGRAVFTGQIQENTGKGELLLTTKFPGGEEGTEKIPWSCSR
jgi:hypothetical protein